jgi:hypothetical protein
MSNFAAKTKGNPRGVWEPQAHQGGLFLNGGVIVAITTVSNTYRQYMHLTLTHRSPPAYPGIPPGAVSNLPRQSHLHAAAYTGCLCRLGGPTRRDYLPRVLSSSLHPVVARVRACR